MSILRCSAMTSSTTCLTWSDLVTSQIAVAAAPPSPAMILTVSFAASGLKSTQVTRAPSRAKRVAVAFPFPQPGPTEPAPNTIATLFCRRPGIVQVNSCWLLSLETIEQHPAFTPVYLSFLQAGPTPRHHSVSSIRCRNRQQQACRGTQRCRLCGIQARASAVPIEASRSCVRPQHADGSLLH